MTITPFTLRLVFEGICMFVPDRPFFQNNAPTEPGPKDLAVLLPDLRVPGLGYWEEDWKLKNLKDVAYRSSHAPILSLSPPDVVGSDHFVVDGMVNDPMTSELRLLHVLDYEELSLAVSPSPLTSDRTLPDPITNQIPTKGKDDKSLWWVLRMSDILPENQLCKKPLLSCRPEDFSKNHITARLHLPGGHLSVSAFNSDGKDYWNLNTVERDASGNMVKPDPNKHCWKKAIGNRIQCDIPVNEAELDLKIASEVVMRPSSVTVRPRVAGGIVEVRIANAELEGLILKPREPWVRPLPDTDFQAYYPLTFYKKKKPWIVPVEKKEPGRLEKPCSSILMSGTG